MVKRKVRWGVISTAGIGRRAVVPAARGASNAEFVAVASRDAGRAREFAGELGLPRHYGSYEALLADGDVDAVYIPLPNSLHHEWTIKAAEAGKHVLCEKPLADNAGQAQEMLDVCGANGVLLMEAFMYRLNPRVRRARELVAEGRIGRPRLVRASFSFSMKRDPVNVRLQPELSGGALADIGCYVVSVARLMFGADPMGVDARLDIDPEFGVDMGGVATLEFTEGRRALLDFSMEMGGRQAFEVVGSTGSLGVDRCFLPPVDSESRLEIKAGAEVTAECFHGVNNYTLELEAFSRAVLEGADLPFPPEDGVRNMRVLDAIKESHAAERPVGLKPIRGAA